MICPHGSGDFYHKYRPRTFDEVVGQETIVSALRSSVSMGSSKSQAYLFCGESGCGKTTLARIFSAALNCEDRVNGNPCCKCSSCVSIMEFGNSDYQEINAADNRGIDEIRRVKETMSASPMFSANKVYVFDECHSLTKEAQQSLLKVLEEAPKNVYIILCSTDPNKLLPTIRNRCQKFLFKSLPVSMLESLLEQVCTYESIDFDKEALRKISDKASGSARDSLVYLQQVFQACGPSIRKDSKELQDIVQDITSESAEAIELCRKLLQKNSWQSIADTYSALAVPAELVRLTVLGYFRTMLTKASSLRDMDKYSTVMDIFINPFYDVKPENNLVLALFKAWRVLSEQRDNANVFKR